MDTFNEQKQIPLDFSIPGPAEYISRNNNPLYEPLDIQLARLMQALNGAPNSVLKNCTLEISKHTREGQIAIPCLQEQQTELLKTQVVGKAGEYKPLIIDNGYLYLDRYWQYQQALEKQIKARIDSTKHENEKDKDKDKDKVHTNWVKKKLDQYFETDNQALAVGETNWQQFAVEQALRHQFLIISGGPGTGKTTTITRILALLIEQHSEQSKINPSHSPLRILLAAPTGKAAIRMLEAINSAQQKLNLAEAIKQNMPAHASTIHKMLGFKADSIQFKHNQNHPLNADVVLVDEASMIDIALMSKLVEAVPPDAKLILMGDKDQLSSVETGSVFADLCISPSRSGTKREPASKKSPESTEPTNNYIVTLKKNWRFPEQSGIGQLAIAANTGNSAQLLEILCDESKPECTLVPQSTQIVNDIIAPWKNYFKILKNPEASLSEIFEAFNQYRILCALRRGLHGSTIMSDRIETGLSKQGLINVRQSSYSIQQAHSWYHGRPVMVTRNSYSKGLFNGDTGITLIRDGKVKVWFPDAEQSYRSYAPVRLPAHETTWAMTIHKSQGSEFDQVSIILPPEIMPILTRQLIYTGITRAKKRVSIVASEAVLRAGVKTEMVRATQIGNKLTEGHLY